MYCHSKPERSEGEESRFMHRRTVVYQRRDSSLRFHSLRPCSLRLRSGQAGQVGQASLRSSERHTIRTILQSRSSRKRIYALSRPLGSSSLPNVVYGPGWLRSRQGRGEGKEGKPQGMAEGRLSKISGQALQKGPEDSAAETIKSFGPCWFARANFISWRSSYKRRISRGRAS
jgi:hypothetical protein